MWKLIKELYYRYKVRAYTSKITSMTKGRKGLKDKQAKATAKREEFQFKLEDIIKEGGK